MRTNAMKSWPGNNLHFHDGSTCHGNPTLRQCIDNSIDHGWEGKVLEKIDKNTSGKEIKCYSLIASDFAHYAKQGKYVAIVERVYKVRYL